LLNGPLPYSSYTKEEMLQRLEKGRPAPRKEDIVFGPHIPSRLRTIVRKATSAKPDERYSSAAEFRDAVAKAPFIDWQPKSADGDGVIWEGATPQRRDRRFRIEARPRRGGRWSLAGLQYVNRWQRFTPDQIVPDTTGAEATAFFDQVVKAALKR
jgi:hypothetical protein